MFGRPSDYYCVSYVFVSVNSDWFINVFEIFFCISSSAMVTKTSPKKGVLSYMKSMTYISHVCWMTVHCLLFSTFLNLLYIRIDKLANGEVSTGKWDKHCRLKTKFHDKTDELCVTNYHRYVPLIVVIILFFKQDIALCDSHQMFCHEQYDGCHVWNWNWLPFRST